MVLIYISGGAGRQRMVIGGVSTSKAGAAPFLARYGVRVASSPSKNVGYIVLAPGVSAASASTTSKARGVPVLTWRQFESRFLGARRSAVKKAKAKPKPKTKSYKYVRVYMNGGAQKTAGRDTCVVGGACAKRMTCRDRAGSLLVCNRQTGQYQTRMGGRAHTKPKLHGFCRAEEVGELRGRFLCTEAPRGQRHEYQWEETERTPAIATTTNNSSRLMAF